ncbi:hypothetical protein X801_01044 [Opisthorchis viverrini]|uniref:Uncharacterized protein n=1 Tax=Opisthorchis viverrini TaxID=6198 RepID=A0A1S8X8J9_OPIVI|nr:hypothetical protein X801_01044 [Opisthorchis viverrini]
MSRFTSVWRIYFSGYLRGVRFCNKRGRSLVAGPNRPKSMGTVSVRKA